MKYDFLHAECGDCQWNMGDNGKGCHCELDNAQIYPDDRACSKFVLWCDLEEDYEYD